MESAETAASVFDSHERYYDIIKHALPLRAAQLGGVTLSGAVRAACIEREIGSHLIAAIVPRMGEMLRQTGDALLSGAQPPSKHQWQQLAAAYELYLAGAPAMRERQFGPLRARSVAGRSDRPKGVAGVRQVTLDVPVAESDRRFDRPPINAECLWQERDSDIVMELFPQVYPFCESQLILHIRRLTEDQANQFLTPEWHDYVWRRLRAAHVPDLIAAWSSLEGGASINSRHWHLTTVKLPIDTPGIWDFDGGTIPYPVAVFITDSIGKSSAWLERCNRENQPYNIIYSPERNRIYHVARRPMSQIRHAHWTSGFAWCEIGGCVLVQNDLQLARLTSAQLRREYRKLQPER